MKGCIVSERQKVFYMWQGLTSHQEITGHFGDESFQSVSNLVALVLTTKSSATMREQTNWSCRKSGRKHSFKYL